MPLAQGSAQKKFSDIYLMRSRLMNSQMMMTVVRIACSFSLFFIKMTAVVIKLTHNIQQVVCL